MLDAINIYLYGKDKKEVHVELHFGERQRVLCFDNPQGHILMEEEAIRWLMAYSSPFKF